MKKIIAIWELMRLEHGFMLALAIIIGSVISLQNSQLFSWNNLQIEKIILTFFTALFLEASTFALNDYYDLEIDIKNKRVDRPLVRGDITKNSALALFFIFFPLGILCSYYVNFTCFIIALITALFAIVYDAYLKKVKLLGNFYIAYVMAIPFVFGAAAVETVQGFHVTINPSVIIVSCIAFLAGSGREIMKDVMDFKGDSVAGVKSFPRYIGIKKSNIIVSFFYLCAIVISFFPFLFPLYQIYHQNFVYLIIVVATDFILANTIYQLLFNDKIDMRRYRKVTLMAIFIGLMAFLLGAFIGY